MMKKTLIAFAAVAACSVSMAQEFKIEGTAALEYSDAKRGDTAGTKSSGFGAAQSEMAFSLKGSLSASQTLEARALIGVANPSGDWTTPVTERSAGKAYFRDVSLTYTNTSFGRIKVYSVEGDDYFNDVAGLGLSGTGQPLIEMDGKLHEIKSSSDGISFATKLGPVYLQVSHAEPKSSIGVGWQDQSEDGNGQTKRTYSAYYNEGPLTLLAGYRTYSNQKDGPCGFGPPSACPAILVTKDSLYNLQGAYDFGPVKVGVGYQNAKATNGATQVDTMVSAAVPMGPWTFAGSYSTSQTSNTPNVSAFGNLQAIGLPFPTGPVWPALQYEGTQNGTSLGAKYAFTKNLSAMVRYATWTHSGYSRLEADGTVKPAALTEYFTTVLTTDGLIRAGVLPPTAYGTLPAAHAAARAATAGLTTNNTASETSIVLAYTF